MNTPDRLTSSDISRLLKRHDIEIVTNRITRPLFAPSREYIAAPLGGRAMTVEELDGIITGVKGPWVVTRRLPRSWEGCIQMGGVMVNGRSEGVNELATIILHPDNNYARRVGYYLRGVSEGVIKPDQRFNDLEMHVIRVKDIMRIESGEVPLPELVDYMKSLGTWIPRPADTTIVVSRAGGS